MNTNENYKSWIDSKKRHRLSHLHVQMAIELGMNPKKMGKIDNHKQEPWKAPLLEFIEHCYFKRFRRERPEQIRTVEEMIKLETNKKILKKELKNKRKQEKAN